MSIQAHAIPRLLELTSVEYRGGRSMKQGLMLTVLILLADDANTLYEIYYSK